MSFDALNLDSRIVKALTHCGYSTPTPVQKQCIPAILKGGDLVASAPTGTGKTAAFILPALHQLAQAMEDQPQQGPRKPRLLILTPTRELATQITQAAIDYGKHLPFRLAALVGGMPYRNQLRDLSRGADIIVATPGRLLDHLQNRKVDLSGIHMLVLDEADRMLDMGFIDDVKQIAKRAPANCQTLLFSATIDARMSTIIRQFLKDPTTINVSGTTLSPAQITQKMYLADSQQHKNQLLRHLLQNENYYKAIIFSGTKINADRLAHDLSTQGYRAAPLHGDLGQSKRNRTIQDFERGKIQFLVATDVAARGIHISDITHVVNYDLPKFSEDYVHRIGRTGRAGKTGTAISFVLPADARSLMKIERFIKQKIAEEQISGLEPRKKPDLSAKKPFRRKPGNPFTKTRVTEGRKRRPTHHASKKPQRPFLRAS